MEVLLEKVVHVECSDGRQSRGRGCCRIGRWTRWTGRRGNSSRGCGWCGGRVDDCHSCGGSLWCLSLPSDGWSCWCCWSCNCWCRCCSWCCWRCCCWHGGGVLWERKRGDGGGEEQERA